MEKNYNHLEVRKEAGSFFVKVNVLRIDYLKAFFTGKLEIKLDSAQAAGVKQTAQSGSRVASVAAKCKNRQEPRR